MIKEGQTIIYKILLRKRQKKQYEQQYITSQIYWGEHTTT